MNYQLANTEFFEIATGLTYATVFKRINAELIRHEFDIDTTEWGQSLPKLLNGLDVSVSGLLVCAFASHPDITVEQLALLTDCIVKGWGNCPDCGGQLEHDETISANPVLTRSIVVCDVCGYSTQVTYETDETY